MRLRFLATPMCASLGLLLGGCASRAPVGPAVVAEVEGKALTVEDVEAYLEANLPAGDDDSERPAAASSSEQDEVKSRLFDNFIDEEVLVFEARRQGVEAGEDEIDAWLRAGTDDTSGAFENGVRRELARRSLTVEKVRGKLVRDRVSVTPDEIDAWVFGHRRAAATDRRLTLTSYKLPSEAEARRLRPRIARARPRPGSVADVQTGNDLESEPLEVELSSLPAEVRAAVVSLDAGEVSEPVSIQGGVYLFRVDAWIEAARDDEDHLRQRAREELLRERHAAASRRIIQELKRGIRLRIEVANLPFRYVPEDAS